MKHFFLYFLSFIFLFTLFLMTPFNAWAGGLNADEQELVAKARGTFEWNGKEYRAKETYIDQLTAYLCMDDVDLDADTCAAAADEMYGNVKRGVEEGYLCETAESGKTVQEVEGKQDSAGSADKGASVSPENSRKTPGGLEPPGGAETQDGLEPPDSPAFTDGQESITAGAGGGGTQAQAGKPDEAENTVPAIFQALSNNSSDEFDNTKNPDRYDRDFGENPGWSLFNLFSYSLIAVFEAVCAVVMVIFLIVTARSRGLKHRRRIRTGMQRATICMTASACFFFGLFTALGTGAFSEQAVLRQIEKTSWYETVYNGIHLETAMALDLLKIPEDGAVEQLQYDNVVLAARQQIKAELGGEEPQLNLSPAMTPLKSSLLEYCRKTYPDSAVVITGAENLMKGLEERCEGLVHWAGLGWWREKTQEFSLYLPVCLGLAVLTLILGALELVCLGRTNYKPVKRIGYSLAGGSVGLILSGWLLPVLGGIKNMRLEPVYMGEFIEAISASAVQSAFLIGGMGCCIAMMLFYISRCMKYES